MTARAEGRSRPNTLKANLDAAWTDLHQSCGQHHLVFWLGWRYALDPFRHTKLGPTWVTLYLGIWSLSVGFLYAPNMGHGAASYLPYVTLGMLLFTAMRTFVAEGSRVFIREGAKILNVPNPFIIYVFGLLVEAAIQVVMGVPVVVITFWYAGLTLGPTAILALPGLVLLFCFGLGISLFLASLAPRFRDIVFATSTLMRFLLFVTPVFWVVSSVSGPRRWIAEINPLYHFMSIVRDPLMGHVPNFHNYLVSGATTLIVLIAGFGLFGSTRAYIAKWL